MATVPAASEAGIVGSAAGLITDIVRLAGYDDWWRLVRPLRTEMRLIICRKISHMRKVQLSQGNRAMPHMI